MIGGQSLHKRLLILLCADKRVAVRCYSATGSDKLENLRRCLLEFNSGAGGVEAMLFTKELFNMYAAFSVKRDGWRWRPVQVDAGPSGGIRSAVVTVEGPECYSMLRFEAGVHRVQRMPITDKSRIHTSTSSVAVLPEPENPEANINPKDCKVETMRASGPGGMNVNMSDSAVRLTHLPTNISLKVMDERFAELNLKIAYKRLASILLQQEIDKIHSKYDSSRRIQVSSLARAAKIRTYNFKERRITDHRLRHSIFTLDDFLAGGESLANMIERLREAYVFQTLEEEQEAAAVCQKTAASSES